MVSLFFYRPAILRWLGFFVPCMQAVFSAVFTDSIQPLSVFNLGGILF